jgi:hypothetical protein
MGKATGSATRAPSRFDVLHMIKRRAEAAGLPYSSCCHTFPGTAITTYLQNGRIRIWGVARGSLTGIFL